VFRWETVLERPRCAVMGVLNVTPDSFSDGGRWLEVDAAVDHGLELVAAGADVVDVGGESTRPGAEPVGADEQIRRVVPVIRTLAARTAVPISIDTTSAAVASAAIEAGATIVNDVTAGRADAGMLATVADAGVGYVVMHMQGEPRTMQADPHYDDVVDEVGRFLVARRDACRVAGIPDDALAVDPGIGFGKTVRHNLELLAALPELARVAEAPVVVGTSRKSFLGRLVGGAPADARDDATLATVAWAIDRGAAIVRVHEVKRAARTAALLAAMRAATPEGVAA
jgi:dihydropteroate synthase